MLHEVVTIPRSNMETAIPRTFLLTTTPKLKQIRTVETILELTTIYCQSFSVKLFLERWRRLPNQVVLVVGTSTFVLT